MVYKSYKKRGGKLCGPYYYHTIRLKNGKTKTIYLGDSSVEAHKKLSEMKKSKLNSNINSIEKAIKRPIKDAHILALLVVALSLTFFISPQFTGFVAGELGAETFYIGTTINETGDVYLNIEKPVNSFSISGTIKGSGIARVYLLDNESARYFLFEFPEPGTSISAGEELSLSFSAVCGEACSVEALQLESLLIEILGDVSVYIDTITYTIEPKPIQIIEDIKEVLSQPIEPVQDVVEDIKDVLSKPTEPVQTGDANEVTGLSPEITDASTAPAINFISPTPDNSSTENLSLIINVSMTNADDLRDLVYNWNGTNYTIYEEDLVLMLNFDNVSAVGENDTNIVGSSIYANNGSCTNCPTFNMTGGKYGGAVQLDGSTQSISIPNTDSLDINNNEVTLALWAKLNELPSEISGETYAGIYHSTTNEYIIYEDSSTSEIRFKIVDNDTTTTQPGIPESDLSTGVWLHIVGVYNGSAGNAKIYLNGVLKDTHTTAGLTGNVRANQAARIGTDGNGNQYYYNGAVDEVRVWNRSLTLEEIQQLYKINLNKYDTDKWTIYANQSNLTDGNYTYYLYANDTSGNENTTGLMNIDFTNVIRCYNASDTNWTITNDVTITEDYTCDIITVTNNSILTINSSGAGNASINLTANIINITSGSKISADITGHTSGAGPGGTPNAVLAGASHGGRGGLGSPMFAPHGTPFYGSSLQPTTPGSGGGESSACNLGGGAIKLIISDKLILNGHITANAANSCVSKGGGSGGSIWVTTNNLTGSGSFHANGSNSVTQSALVGIGGGGGGGRIAVYYNYSDFSSYTSSVSGGRASCTSGSCASGGSCFYYCSGNYNGSSGTMVFIDMDNNTAIINDGFSFQNETVNVTNIYNTESSGIFNFNNLTIVDSSKTRINVTPFHLNVTDTLNTTNITWNYTMLQPSVKFTYGNNFIGANQTFDNNFNLTVERRNIGKIEWLTNLTNVSNITENINLSSNYVFVNSTTVSGLNQSANITIYNSSLTNPSAQVDFNDDGSYETCSICTQLGWSGGTYIFNTTHFTTYQLVENSATPKIDFISPTPADNANTSNTSVEINISVTNAENFSKFIWNWNGTNFSIYDENLVAMFNFDNMSALGESYSSSDSVIVDLSRNDNNGTTKNSLAWNSTGKYGGAMQFDGNNDYISLGQIQNGATIFTWELWLKTSQSDGHSLFYQSPVIIGTIQGSDNTNDALLLNRYGELMWYDELSGDTHIDTNQTINDGVWHHIVASRDGDTLSFYIDGSLISSNSIGVEGINNNGLEIAKANWNQNEFFNGTIDEVRIWDRSLSAAEIQQLYMSNLNKYDTDKWSFYVNQTKNTTAGLTDGNYTYYAYVNDTNGNENSTGVRELSINGGCYESSSNWTISSNVTINQNYTCDVVTITNNAVLTFNSSGAGNASINLTANIINITSGSRISADETGYTSDAGPGAGGDTSNTLGHGASHGGIGGKGSTIESASLAQPYGSSFQPTIPGSGGGLNTIGSKGGGVIHLIITDKLILNGRITADAENNATTESGSGAGGSILIVVKNITGSGNLSAKGGDTYTTGVADLGGAGGGGRIAVYYNYSDFNPYTSSVSGGVANLADPVFYIAGDGSPGTMIFIDEDNNTATIVEGFRFQGETINVSNIYSTENSGVFNFTNVTIVNTANIRINVTSFHLNATDTLNFTNMTWNYTMTQPSIKFTYGTDFIGSNQTFVNNFNLTVERRNIGKIEWLTNLTNVSNITENINLSSNYVLVNTTTVSGLNQSANITIYNSSITIPSAQVDFNDDGSYETCSICTEISWSGGTYKFNTTHFTAYQLTESTSNTTPSVSSVTLNSTSTNNYTTDNLTCHAVGIDPDTATITAHFDWYNNSVLQSTLTGSKTSISNNTLTLISTLDSSNTTKNQNWTCSVKFGDGESNSSYTNSSILTIQNTPPNQTAPLLNSTSGQNMTTDNITCYNQSTSDIDGDSVTNLIRWYVNDSLQSGFENDTTITTENLSLGDEWICEITPSDDEEDGTALNSSILSSLSRDTPPRVTNIELIPEFPTIADEVNCSAIITDNESSTINANFTWYINAGRITTYDSTVSCQNNTRCYTGTLLPMEDYEEENVSCGISAWGVVQAPQSLSLTSWLTNLFTGKITLGGFITGFITNRNPSITLTEDGLNATSSIEISYTRIVTSLSPNINCTLTPNNIGRMGMVNITCNATDDRMISDVWANINTPSISDINMRMDLISGNYSNGTFYLPFRGTIENGTYSVVGVYVNDTQGVKNSSDPMNFSVDIYYPAVYGSVTPPNATQNETINIIGEVPDSDVHTVWAMMVDAYKRITNKTMSSIGSNLYKTNFSANVTGVYAIYVFANDSVGNTNRTYAGPLTISGDSAPYISMYNINPNITQNTTSIYIDAKVEDDWGVESVESTIQLPDGSSNSYNMTRFDKDQERVNMTDNVSIMCGDYLAQQFTPQITAYLPKISLNISREGNTNLSVEIYSDYYDRPRSNMATVYINESNVSTTANWTNFTFVDRAFLIKGGKYWIVLTPTNCDGNFTVFGGSSGSGVSAYFANTEDEAGKIWNETTPIAYRTYYLEENMYRLVYGYMPYDGNHTINITAKDSAYQIHRISDTFIVDSVPPSISAYSVTSTVAKSNNFTAYTNVSDTNLDGVIFTVIDPFGRRVEMNRTSVSGERYTLSYNTVITGNYSVEVSANDRANNWNYTAIGTTVVTGPDTSPPIIYSYVFLNRSRQTGDNTSIYISVRDNNNTDTVFGNITYSAYIKNNDFESGISEWALLRGGGPTINTTNLTAYSGNYSLNISSRKYGYAYLRQYFKPISQNFTYNFSFYLLNPTGWMWNQLCGPAFCPLVVRIYKNRGMYMHCFGTNAWVFWQNIPKNQWHNISLVVDWESRNCSFYYNSVLKKSLAGGFYNESYVYYNNIGDVAWSTSYGGDVLFDNIELTTNETAQDETLAFEPVTLANFTDDFSPTSGTYTSKVFDAGSSVTWNNISWVERFPYGKLPDNRQVETVMGGANMTGNIVLLHLNNDTAYGENDTHTYDFSGNGNNGTFVGLTGTSQANWTTGRVGNGLDFDGVNDFVIVPSDNLFTSGYSKDMTFSMHIKSDDYTPSSQVILSRRHPCNNNGHFMIYINGNRVYFTFYTNLDVATKTLYSEQILTDGEWYHIVWVKKWGATGTKLYVNGTEVSFTGDTANRGTTYSNLPVYIGAQNGGSGCNGATKNFFNGIIDEVKIWNRALTASEIINIYTNETAGQYDAGMSRTLLVGEWHLNESSGITAADTSNQDNHGILTTSGPTDYGRIGAGLSFDGINDYVNLGQVLDTDKTKPFTLEAWVNVNDDRQWRTIIGTDTSLAQITISSATDVRFGQNGGGGWWLTGGSVIPGNWYHIVGTYDGTNAKLYVNGELKRGPYVRTFTNNHGVSLLGRYSTGGGEWFSGVMDEVAIYNRSLSAQEISDHYNRGVMRLNLTVRSCDDSACSGESWDDTYNETPSNLSVSDNRYFQYKANFDSYNPLLTPRLYNVTVAYPGGTFVTNASNVNNATHNKTAYALDGYIFAQSFGEWETYRNWVIESGKLKIKQNANAYALTGKQEWMDYEYSVNIIPNDDDVVGIYFRYIDKNNYYLIETANSNISWANSPYTGVKLVKYYGGIDVGSEKIRKELAYTDRVRYEIGDEFNLKVVVREDNIKVYWDNDLIIDKTDGDDPHTHGKIGFFSDWHSNAEFDDVSVIPISTGMYLGNYTHNSTEGMFAVTMNANDSAGNLKTKELDYLITDNTAPTISYFEIHPWNLQGVCGNHWPLLRVQNARDESDIDRVVANITAAGRTYTNKEFYLPWWATSWYYNYFHAPEGGTVDANISIIDKAGNVLNKNITRELTPICLLTNGRNTYMNQYYRMKNESIQVYATALKGIVNITLYEENETKLVPAGSTYKFYRMFSCGESNDPRESTCTDPSDWEKEGFDDSNWLNATTIRRETSCDRCVGLFRKTFNASNVTNITGAELFLARQSIECYINNQSVAHDSYRTGNGYKWMYRTNLNKSLILEGENTLACKVKGYPYTWGYLDFDAELVAYYIENRSSIYSANVSADSNGRSRITYTIPNNGSYGIYLVNASNGTDSYTKSFFVLATTIDSPVIERWEDDLIISANTSDNINEEFDLSYSQHDFYPFVVNTSSNKTTGIWAQRTSRNIEVTILLPDMLMSPGDIIQLLGIYKNYGDDRKIRLSGGRIFPSYYSNWYNEMMYTHYYRNYDIGEREILTADLVMEDYRPLQSLGQNNYAIRTKYSVPTRYVPARTYVWGYEWYEEGKHWRWIYSMNIRGPFIVPEELKGEVLYGAMTRPYGFKEGENKLEDAYKPGATLAALTSNKFGIGMESVYNQTLDFDLPNITSVCYPNPSYNQTITCNATISDISNITNITFGFGADVLFNESFENQTNLTSYNFTEENKIIYDEQDPGMFKETSGWDGFQGNRTNATSRSGNYSFAVTVPQGRTGSTDLWRSKDIPTSFGVEKLGFSYKKSRAGSYPVLYFYVNGRWHQIYESTNWYQGWRISRAGTDWVDVEFELNDQNRGSGRQTKVSQNGRIEHFQLGIGSGRAGDTVYFDNIRLYYDMDNGDTDNITNRTNEKAYSGNYSLKLTNDTWSSQNTSFELSENTSLHFYMYSESQVEIQGIGITNGTTHIVYPLYGTQKYMPPKAINRYWNLKPNLTWQEFNIPIGKDWNDKHNSYTNITSIIYINDGDNSTKKGIVYFDNINVVDVDGDDVSKIGDVYSTNFLNSTIGNHTYVWKVVDKNNNTNFFTNNIEVLSLPDNFTLNISFNFSAGNTTGNDTDPPNITIIIWNGTQNISVGNGTNSSNVTLPPNTLVNINITAYNHTFSMINYNFTGNFNVSPLFIRFLDLPRLMVNLTRGISFNDIPSVRYDNVTIVLYKEFDANRICKCNSVSLGSSGFECATTWTCDIFSAYSATDSGTHVSFTVTSFSAYTLALLDPYAPDWTNYTVNPQITERCGESITATAQWNENVNESYVEYNSTTSTLINYTANITVDNSTYLVIQPNASWIKGNHSVKIYAKDEAGNWNSTTTSVFNVTNSPPEFVPQSIADPGTINYTDTFIYDINATDACENSTIEYTTNSTLLTINSTTGIINWTSNYSYVGLHTIYVTASDGENNVTDSFLLKINDSDSPNVTLTSPANGTTFTSSNSITFSYSVNDTSDSVQCWLTYWTLINMQRLLPPVNSEITSMASGTGTVSQTLSNGNYDWRVTCRDVFGNEGTVNQTYSLTVSYTASSDDDDNPGGGSTVGTTGGGALPVSDDGEADLDVSPDSIFIETGPGREVSETLEIENNGTETGTFKIYGTGDIASAIKKQTVVIAAGEIKKISIKIQVSQDTPVGNYSGYIVVETGDKKKQIPFTLVVLEELRGLLDMVLTLSNSTVVIGGEAIYTIDMSYFGERSPVIVNVLARIMKGGSVISEYKETVAIGDELNLIRSMEIPRNTPPGEYELNIEVFYLDSKAVASSTITVLPPSGVSAVPAWGYLTIIIVTILLIVIVIINQRKNNK